MKCISTFDAIFSEPLFKYLQVLNNRFTMVPVFKLREKIIEIENWVFIIVVFSIELIADLCIRDNKGNLYTSTLFGWKNNEIFALMFDLFLSKSFQGRVLECNSELGLEYPDFHLRPQGYDRRPTQFFIGDSQIFYQRPLKCHQRHQLFIIDPQIFIGGAIFSWETPIYSSETPRFSSETPMSSLKTQ